MDKITFEEITRYILFLRKCGYFVSLSSLSEVFAAYISDFFEYIIHPPFICNYMKSHPANTKRCILRKRQFEKLVFEKPFYGFCYAGVEEYVYPIHYEGKQIICVHISGYRGKSEKAMHYAALCEQRFGNGYKTMYQALSDDVPDITNIESLAAPLKYMFITLYEELKRTPIKQTPAQILCSAATEYIYTNYMNHIQCRDIAHALGYSESHLRSVFKSETGMSLADKLNKVRLERAAYFLKNSNMTITEIAFACGFENPSYFSTVFTKTWHIPPKRFRKS